LIDLVAFLDGQRLMEFRARRALDRCAFWRSKGKGRGQNDWASRSGAVHTTKVVTPGTCTPLRMALGDHAKDKHGFGNGNIRTDTCTSMVQSYFVSMYITINSIMDLDSSGTRCFIDPT
jgi:hypothetical protein